MIIDYGTAETYHLLGRASLLTGDHTTASMALNGSSFEDGTLSTLHHLSTTAIYYYGIQEKSSCLDKLEQAIFLDPEIWTLWHNRGVLVRPLIHSFAGIKETNLCTR